jgi:hypothetical protein
LSERRQVCTSEPWATAVQILLGALSADIHFSFGCDYSGIKFGIDVLEDTGTKISVYYN